MNTKSMAQYGAPTLAVVLIWGAIAGYPSMRSLRAAEDRVTVAESERSSLLRSFEEVRGLADAQEATLRQIDELELSIPGAIELGSLIKAVDMAGTLNGVAVEGLSPIQIDDGSSGEVAVATPAGISSVTFGLTVVGEYESLVSFLETLERTERLLLLDSVVVHAELQNTGVLTAEIVMRVFTSAAITRSGTSGSFPDEALAFDDGQTVADGATAAPVLPPGLSEEEITAFLASVEDGE